MSSWDIETYGQTSRIEITEAQIAATIGDIESVRRNIRKLADWSVSREEAIEMTTDVKRMVQIDRIHAKAMRMIDRIGRRRTYEADED